MIQGKASQVFINGNSVLKVFDRTQSKGYRGSGEQSYLREKECLKRLQGNIHFPELIHCDDNNLSIEMSYCGKVFPYDGKPRPEMLQQVWQISEALDSNNIKLYGGTLQKNNLLLHDGIIKLVELLNKYKNVENVEIEIRLGYIETDPHSFFDTNITEDYYNKINDTLGTYKNWDYNDNKTTTDYYYDDNLRLSIDTEGNRSAMKKVRLVDIDMAYDSGPFDIRISVSQEIPIDPNDISGAIYFLISDNFLSS